jgi:hypothetical protein
MLQLLIFFLKFHYKRIRKWVAILFKKNRQLERVSFDYYKNWHSECSFLVVDFKFRNAIYFKVGGAKSFDFSIPLILNLQNINTNKIKIEVYGFLQKEILFIELNKEIRLNTNSFKTTIENLRLVELTRQKIKRTKDNIWFANEKPKVDVQCFSVNLNNIKINFSKFKIQEYI